MTPCVPVNVSQISLVWKMKSYNLIDTVFEGLMAHSLFTLVFTHERKGTLQLIGLVGRGNAPHHHEQGVQILQSGIVVFLTRRRFHLSFPHPSKESPRRTEKIVRNPRRNWRTVAMQLNRRYASHA